VAVAVVVVVAELTLSCGIAWVVGWPMLRHPSKLHSCIHYCVVHAAIRIVDLSIIVLQVKVRRIALLWLSLSLAVTGCVPW
jgi:hypothetical protein